MSAGIFSVLDDVTNLADDIAAIGKTAGAKTATITGDDLAVNSQAVLGMNPKKELQIIKRIAKGSLVNKAILGPAGLILGAVAPASIPLLLMAGGAYFCYEGAHKILHRGTHEEGEHAAQSMTPEEAKAAEEKKIKGAIRTDFLLSAEIMAITLATAAGASLLVQAGVLALIGVATTVGIYGIVGGIVKLDDLGAHLLGKEGNSLLSKALRKTGGAVVAAAPKIMRGLEIVGTAAMLMVGGGLVTGGISALEHLAVKAVEVLPAIIPHAVAHAAVEIVAGLVTGLASLPVVKVAAPLVKKGFSAIRRVLPFGKKGEKKTAPAPTPQPQAAPAAPSAAPIIIKAGASIKGELNQKAAPQKPEAPTAEAPAAASKAPPTPPAAPTP